MIGRIVWIEPATARVDPVASDSANKQNSFANSVSIVELFVSITLYNLSISGCLNLVDLT